MHLNEPVIVTFKDKRILKGHIDGEYDPDIMSKFILIIDGESNLIELKDVKQIETDFETMSEKIKEKLEVWQSRWAIHLFYWLYGVNWHFYVIIICEENE